MSDNKIEVSATSREVDRHVTSTFDHGITPHRRPWWALGGQDQSFATARPETSVVPSTSSKEDVHSNNNDIQQSVFADSQAAEYYEPIEKYEGRHRFDPHATWSDEEERKLVRRVSTDFQHERDCE